MLGVKLVPGNFLLYSVLTTHITKSSGTDAVGVTLGGICRDSSRITSPNFTPYVHTYIYTTC